VIRLQQALEESLADNVRIKRERELFAGMLEKMLNRQAAGQAAGGDATSLSSLADYQMGSPAANPSHRSSFVDSARASVASATSPRPDVVAAAGDSDERAAAPLALKWMMRQVEDDGPDGLGDIGTLKL